MFQRLESDTFILRMRGSHKAATGVFRQPANDRRGRHTLPAWLAGALAVCALAAAAGPLGAQQAPPQQPAAETQQPAPQAPAAEAPQPSTQQPAAESQQPATPQPAPQQSRFRHLMQKPGSLLKRPSSQKPAIETTQQSPQTPADETPKTSPQQPSPQQPPPETQQSAPQTPAAETQQPQGPGVGEKVHTGVTSGLDTDARLQNLLADHQFFRVEAQLEQLPPDQAQLYRGILANRNNDLDASIKLLEPLVDKVAAGGNTGQEKLLRKALAEDYLRSGDLAKANRAYQALDSRLQGKLSADEQDEIEMPLKLLPLAATNPPMTVEPADPFLLQVGRNPLGLIDLPVYVDARPHSWMLDPTAPFNLISRSLAKEAGLTVSDAASTIHTLTGRPMQVHVTVIPRFTIGGRITYRDMTAFVFEDADYFFPQSRYQVQGVLGYSALSALGSITITADATVAIEPAKLLEPDEKTGSAGNDSQPAQGARFFFDGDRMILALSKTGAPSDGSSSMGSKTGEERMYAVDAGGQQTYLTSRYYEENASDFNGQKMALFTIPGSQNLPPQPAYLAETVPLTVGPYTVHVNYIQVLTQPLGSAALDDVYGVLGLDALDQLLAYTFDYRTMRFSVKPEE